MQAMQIVVCLYILSVSDSISLLRNSELVKLAHTQEIHLNRAHVANPLTEIIQIVLLPEGVKT